MRNVRWIVPLLVLAALEGCFVRTRGYGGGCPGGVFIEGHRGPRGRWHEGHWRCPGVVEVVEID